MNILLLPIMLPLIAGLVILLIPKKVRYANETIVLLATAANLVITYWLFGKTLSFHAPWAGFGLEFSLRLYHFSAFIIAAAATFGFLIAWYSLSFLKDKGYAKLFYCYLLITIAFVNGAVLADNLALLLFFWEGLLLTLFGMILIGGKNSFKTAIKAFTINGVTDLCLMVGIALTAYLAGTLTISRIHLSLVPLAAAAFTLLMIGAVSKAGSMPFHTWIPDAALDAPLPFMAFLPGAIEKLVGIYFLARISLDLFKLTPGSWLSYLLMTIGAITIICAVMMALIQKNYKKLLSYHAISQVGYMILGIGTMVPVGIVGGLFHMINNAMYKSCLFLTGGAVEKEAGTTDLEQLGGLGWKMPVTFFCFVIAAVSISGVPPFNGFFSKELIYDAALERGLIFYLAAVIGSFFTAASFLKLGHAAYLGKGKQTAKEAPWPMLLPMLIIALACVVFGVFNALPINQLIQPILGHNVKGLSFAGWPASSALVIVTLLVLAGALLNHWFGVKKYGQGIKAVDHIHYAPGLAQVYDKAEKKYFDPYDLGLKTVGWVSRLAFWCDRGLDWVYDGLVVNVTYAFTNILKLAHNGNFVNYLVWSLVGTALVVIMLW
ncbi:MAG: proton-conducting transporter membrane subunit [Candidatus Margulisbacteria bacterium]|nr:proton-conducting transporter membrane subunit [Candidatus Margulisiibacteriota bacterium]